MLSPVTFLLNPTISNVFLLLPEARLPLKDQIYILLLLIRHMFRITCLSAHTSLGGRPFSSSLFVVLCAFGHSVASKF